MCHYARIAHLPPGLLESLLPGPVTLLLERLPGTLSEELNPGVLHIGTAHGRAPLLLSNSLSGLIQLSAAPGIRVPDSPFVRAVAREFGAPLALTSANRSGSMSSVSVEEFSDLWDKARRRPDDTQPSG